jgi:hypothetical protein
MTGRFAINNHHVSSLSQLPDTKGFLSLGSLPVSVAGNAPKGRVQIRYDFPSWSLRSTMRLIAGSFKFKIMEVLIGLDGLPVPLCDSPRLVFCNP